MAHLRYYALLHSLDDSTALFTGMGAVAEAAFVDVLREFAEAAGELLLAYDIIAIRLKCRKAGSIGDISAAVKLVQDSRLS